MIQEAGAHNITAFNSKLKSLLGFEDKSDPDLVRGCEDKSADFERDERHEAVANEWKADADVSGSSHAR